MFSIRTSGNHNRGKDDSRASIALANDVQVFVSSHFANGYATATFTLILGQTLLYLRDSELLNRYRILLSLSSVLSLLYLDSPLLSIAIYFGPVKAHFAESTERQNYIYCEDGGRSRTCTL